MPFKSGSGGGTDAGEGDWFFDRFRQARTLVPAAQFDTILGMEFDETITAETADVVGVAAASAASGIPAGGMTVTAGDDVVAPCSVRWQPTGCGSHIRMLHDPWYLAALARYSGPFPAGTLVGSTQADVLALRGFGFGDDNRVSLGVYGVGPGGSTTNWVGLIRTGASDVATTIGPAIPAGPLGVFGLFEMWNDGTLVHCAINGVEFASTMPTADLPFQTAMISPTVALAVVTNSADPLDRAATITWDKHVMVVRAPQVGSPD